MARKTKPLYVGLIGQRFMGRAHSNAYRQVGRFFDLPLEPVMHTVAGRDEEALSAFARRQGWKATTGRWRDLAANPQIDLVDVATPNHLHAEQAVAMLEAGKHVACEKPLAGTLEDARRMRDAARKAKNQKTFVWFNYRRTPAAAFAWRLVRERTLGKVYHVRATYLQSWGGPEAPLSWRFRKRYAGSGAHSDLNAHLVDLTRFLLSENVTAVHGAVARTFVRERVLPDARRKKGKSDVDDALLFLASFESGALASFEASRVAAPHQNACSIEIDGQHGSLRFQLEDPNVLWFHDANDGKREGGWRRILCTSAGHHPYAEHWWPDGHPTGYEHGFTNMLADVLRSLARRRPELPLADFADAWETQRVLEAATLAVRERQEIKLREVT